MSLKDIIVISVLINAGVLTILFITAWNPDDNADNVLSIEEPVVDMRSEVPQRPSSLVGIDEVDRILQQHSVVELYPTRPEIVKEGCVEVTVKRGDHLDEIALANGTTVEAIMEANHLTDLRVQVGQVLWVPKGIKKTTLPSMETEGFDYYIIQRGENPWTISQKLKIKFSDLIKLNDLDDDKARKLRQGDKLKIPKNIFHS